MKELEIRAKLDTMLSLPLPLARLERSLGTVTWPGQPTRVNFPSGLSLSEEDRKHLTARLEEVQHAMSGQNLDQMACMKARLSLLTKMLLAYPTAGASTEAAMEAKLSFYEEAVSDIAPWAVDASIKRWVRGDIGKGNVDFPPSPGALRRMCEEELEPFKVQAFRINRLLSAVSIDRAMDPKPLETNLPKLRVMSNVQ